MLLFLPLEYIIIRHLIIFMQHMIMMLLEIASRHSFSQKMSEGKFRL